ncbi:MBL fold metallo-hydrolase [Aquibaculum arenosum]|uniref:MBL fold metallo-hydrolase n=1 Tax=Aquibaculum arenosum TaxID=3032591 RepID=A0ABT5YPU4_9PROT|nr:MBL fold metallo-hydrolase [Fodinicurvata sp. CAU 1616]MDF2096976.1 MBL fold metallo-hydrolase [Fodinicurvata sp. CAU 1616]
MRLETIGHATLLLQDAAGAPLLATDPWLTGSTYWRSWWIENYPGPAEIARLAASPWLYISHEHPDHYHPPSLRLLRDQGADPQVLLPPFLSMGMEGHLQELGYRTRRLPEEGWLRLAPDLQVLSIALWNNDSILLLDTPEALIVNLNDAKPDDRSLRRLGALRAALGKRCVLLRSYSPASPMNSYWQNGKRVERGGKRGYVRAAAKACRLIGADDFVPFASQVVFRRADTDWANDFKVRYADLRRFWGAPARLHQPYSCLELGGAEVTRQDPATFDPHVTARTRALVAEQEEANRQARFTPKDHARLEQSLRQLRSLLRAWLPKGFSIKADGVRLFWNSLRGRLEQRDKHSKAGHFTLSMPLLPLKQAATFGHLGDLSIPMFTRIELHGPTRPRRVDVFFMLLILRDYGYLGAPGRTLRWLRWAAKLRLQARRPLPRPDAAAPTSAAAPQAGGLAPARGK